MLVNAGANINLPEDYGFLPLHEAIIAGNYQNAKYLIENGADVKHAIYRADGAYVKGDDAKAIATKSRNQEILELF
ncbi:Ankyrin repeat protein [compost metagenome]